MMRHYRLLTAFTIAGALFLSCADKQDQSQLVGRIVETKYGRLQGAVNQSRTVVAFKGIPFAAPPVGQLRWREPQPPVGWDGVRDATQFCASCIQPSNRRLPWTDEYMIRNETSEDCLFLNLWTPAELASDSLPVLIWIHGGGFREGSGSIDVYDGEELAKKGIIVVTINYRLGVLGFLAHPWLTAESPHQASGNYGFMDQVAALNWVQENIAAFGGDPEKVTISGQSAGARSVHVLTASPLAKGLFKGAIAVSGSSMSRMTSLMTLADAEAKGVELANSKGASSLAELRAIPAADLIADFSCSVDGWVLPEGMAAIFEKGQQNDVSTITGLTADERSSRAGYGKSTVAEFVETAKENYGDEYEMFLRLYPVNSDEEAGLKSIEAARDKGRFDLCEWAEFRSMTAKTPAYTYFFERGIPWPEHPEFGAFHTGDVAYWFNNLKMLDRPWTPADTALAETVSSYWVNFVTHGDPNGDGLPDWPAFDKSRRETLKLGTEISVIPIASEEKIEFLKGS
jgi:para-nitrobenzyl esterase